MASGPRVACGAEPIAALHSSVAVQTHSAAMKWRCKGSWNTWKGPRDCLELPQNADHASQDRDV